MSLLKIKNLKLRKGFVLVFSLLFFIGAVLFGAEFLLTQKDSLLKKYSATVISACAQAEYRPSCYDTEIPKLMDLGLSMEEAFEVTRFVQQEDDAYFYCHVLGHYLSAKETAKDPSKWKEVVARVPGGICSNGGIHGAFQERFRSESLPEAGIEDLKPILADICKQRDNWDPTPLERATCTHAIGHLTMYVTDADINKSIQLCDEASIKEEGRDFTQLCYDGAFMQLFQPLDLEDIALVEGKQPTKENVSSFCWLFQGEKRSSCWSEAWPLFFDEIKTSHGLINHCSQMGENPKEENRCFSALFYVLGSQFGSDEERIIDFCSNLPKERMGQCFANAASRMIEIDWGNIEKTTTICTAAKENGVGNQCYDELLLYSGYNFVVGSDPFFHLCEGLPEPWKEQCLSQSK